MPAGLATIFTGSLLLVTRRKALTQVVGYLVLENGIYLFGLMLRAGFILTLVGYGTKMGIAPLHTWKPDACGETPGSWAPCWREA